MFSFQGHPKIALLPRKIYHRHSPKPTLTSTDSKVTAILYSIKKQVPQEITAHLFALKLLKGRLHNSDFSRKRQATTFQFKLHLNSYRDKFLFLKTVGLILILLNFSSNFSYLSPVDESRNVNETTASLKATHKKTTQPFRL